MFLKVDLTINVLDSAFGAGDLEGVEDWVQRMGILLPGAGNGIQVKKLTILCLALNDPAWNIVADFHFFTLGS